MISAVASASGGACWELFESCLSMEVKVVECAAGGATENGVEQCVICTGVLRSAHRVADLDGTPADHPTTRDDSDSAAVLEDALSPSRLLSGQYEVLLYTLYNPETEIDVALVGRASVSLYVPELDLDPMQLDAVLARTGRFDPARFLESPNDRLAFLYWSARLSCCCFDLLSVGAMSTLSNSTSALTERVAAAQELEALLCTLALPKYSEKVVLSKIISHLELATTPERKVAIISALDNYFQVSISIMAMIMLYVLSVAVCLGVVGRRGAERAHGCRHRGPHCWAAIEPCRARLSGTGSQQGGTFPWQKSVRQEAR